ncbi:MAG: hypothetical protein IKT73_10270 [Anaerotignum sp.]|nr:hypothetical protein [Anaerotignum sp.]
MKTYRKKMIGMILAMLFCFSPVCVTAAELPVTISSGLNTEAAEVTFDDERIVYGEAAPGTQVTFTISKQNRFGEMVELHKNTVTVGSMGLFSVTLPLERGSNYIEMTAGGETQQVVVKRVSQTVKTQLKRMIALPGLSILL